jgi:glycogen debranching enzyme
MAEHVTMLEGNTFLVSDARGDIEASATDPTGLFSYDTRFLSTWRLWINGERLSALSTDDLQYFQTRFFLVPGSGSVYVDSQLAVIRERSVDRGFHESLKVLNHAAVPVHIDLRIDADADFADLFEVKDALKKKGTYRRSVEDGHLVLAYRRETFRRACRIRTSDSADVDRNGVRCSVDIAAHGEWSAEIDVKISMGSWDTVEDPFPSGSRRSKRAAATLARGLEKWMHRSPRLTSDWEPLNLIYQRSMTDLAALRFSTRTMPGRWLPAAGLPWFMTLFGRDSIFTSLQALPFAPELASTTLLALGERQGSRVDGFRDEDPGRILHELRFGELTAFEERPHSPYFGSADATPLYVVLLDEYERWTGDTRLVRQLEPCARAALAWTERYADLQGNGYTSYRRRNEETGLENQCWKDSWDSICFRDGTLPSFPRATCELQGYVYDARMRAARLARDVWRDPAFADRLEADAADLKRRFNQDFWVEDGQYFALALDPDGRQVDALASNIGHLLWSGIVDDAKADAVVGHLMGPRMFSGWGVRTLAEGQGRYNPIGYHVGTVWPFDTSFIAWGLRRYGYKAEATALASGITHAASFFNGRLPEAFGGYARHETRFPVQYPTACSPQAWSTGAPLLLIRTMLGLEPIGDHLVVDPVLPADIGWLELLDIPGRWGRVDAFGRGRIGAGAPHRPSRRRSRGAE